MHLAVHTAGVGRADVWVFDAERPGSGVGGRPLRIVELFGDTPRALAACPDGDTVYAAVFHSGNQTSVIHEGVMCRGFEDTPRGNFVGATWARRRGNQPCIAGQMPARFATSSPNGPADKTLPMGRPFAEHRRGRRTCTVHRHDREVARAIRGVAGLPRINYSNVIRFFLPDKDVFAIDAVTLEETASFRHVGTTLFNMAVNPVNGVIYVASRDGTSPSLRPHNHKTDGHGARLRHVCIGELAEWSTA